MTPIRFTLPFLLFSLLLVVPAAAQDQAVRAAQGGVSGVVIDAATKQPLPSATVAVRSLPDSALVTGAVTLPDGTFTIDGLRPGPYYLHLSFVGYDSRRIGDVTIERGALDLGQLALTADTQVLDGVEVTAEREFMEVAIDRTVYNTKDQLVSAGGNASDVLQNIPSVEVDIDGNISLRGSQSVAILINGRPSPLQGEALTSFLVGLPSDMIERVEVIPNPSARYDPDGMSGILNIVLKQDRDLGLSGSATAGIATGDSYNASTNINYQTGPWTLYTGYSYRTGTRDRSGTRYRENRFRTPLTFLETADLSEGIRTSHTLNTGVDYKLGAQTTLGIASILSFRGGEQEGFTAYTELDEFRDVTARYDRLNAGERDDLNTDLRLSLRRILDPSKHELVAEIRYEREIEDDFERFEEQFLTGDGSALLDLADLQTNREDELSNEGSLQLDYLRPLGAAGKLEAGYKGSFDRLDSGFYSESLDPVVGELTPDIDLNNDFLFDEQIHAVYGILGNQFGRFGTQVGLRLEQAFTTFDLTTTDESFDNNYFSVFPSAFMTYELSQSNTLKISYSKRIDRPGTWALNPFDSFDDPLFRRVGNPYLQPEYIHSFEASYTRFSRGTSLTLTPYFRHTVDVIQRYVSIDDQGVSTLTFENFDTSDSWGAEAIGTLKLGDLGNAYASFNAYRVVTDGSNVDTDLSNNAFGYNMRTNATLNVYPGLAVQLSYFYRSPIDIPGSGRISSFSMADVALRQQFMDKRASLSLRMSDVFNTMGFDMWREDDRAYETLSRNWDSQNAFLTFTYSFGRPDRNRDRNRGRDRGGDDGMEGMDY